MLCPFCREKDTSVVDSRPTEDGTGNWITNHPAMQTQELTWT